MTDSVILRVAQKELRLFFSSPVAWFFLGSFIAASLFIFFWVEAFFARNIADVRPLFEWMPVLLIFLAAALTMRMWSEERRSGTLEYLLTQPAPLWQFVLGKFLACSALLLLALSATLPLPLTVASLADIDWGPVVAGYLATALVGAAYISIGLFVSARTDNAMVSLMGSVLLGGMLYLIGSSLLTGFFGDSVAQTLRLLGSGSRFESITRGVIDARDLYYYAAICVAFLALNVYTLDRSRWSQAAHTRQRYWRAGIALLIANLFAAGLWLQQLPMLRADVTRGNLYSLSEPSYEMLGQLKEPLLIRGYFSERTHPLLAPLVPQLKDLLREYALAADGRVRVEFVDPAQNPQLEQEANEDYGIYATPFQVADRYQSALVNAYFNVLVQYGGEKQVLGFGDLIEVKAATGTQPEVVLRNPEFDLTRAIRDALFAYRTGGNLFEQIASPIRFTAYVSRDDLLPEVLLTYKAAIGEELARLTEQAAGKFSVSFIEPEADAGEVARRIMDEWGFQPMLAALDDQQEFFFYLTLEDDHQVVQLPTGNFAADAFADTMEAGLKRFARGFTKTVALVLPPAQGMGGMPGMPQMPDSRHTFNTLEQSISGEYTIVRESLDDGAVDSGADLLLLVAPENLSGDAVYALDQYLMRGGTVILATSPFAVELAGGQLQMRSLDSGLADWLVHLGVTPQPELVLDRQNGAFPVPVVRRVGGYEFRDMQYLDYPFFIDLRSPGLNGEHPITSGLPNLTMAWASPLQLADTISTQQTILLQSSGESWRSTSMNVMPQITADGSSGFSPAATDTLAPATVGVLLQGRFDSFFAEAPADAGAAADAVPADGEPAESASFGAHLRRSPEAARLMVFASSDFLSDQVLSGVVAASGTQYLSPVELMMNAIDWSVADGNLLQIRSRAHFNRTLPPLQEQAQARIEYLNYALGLGILALLGCLHWLFTRRRLSAFRRALA